MASIPRGRPDGPALSVDPSGSIGRLGSLALLASRSIGAWLRARPGSGLYSDTVAEVDRLVVMGVPLVGLVHVGMGSFLAMQAYFGATFVDGIGPVVGVGLIRNLAPMLAGFVLSGLVAALYVPGLRNRAGGDEVALVAPRLLAASIAGPILGAWGSVVGTLVGFGVAHSMIGLSAPGFFDTFLEMLWVRDIAGLVLKGAGFGFVSALLACRAGLSRPPVGGDGPAASAAGAACRAATLGCLALLLMNSAWFLLIYHAGPPFGPTVLTPPKG